MDSLVVIAWGAVAIGLNIGIGRWCRTRTPVVGTPCDQDAAPLPRTRPAEHAR